MEDSLYPATVTVNRVSPTHVTGIMRMVGVVIETEALLYPTIFSPTLFN